MSLLDEKRITLNTLAQQQDVSSATIWRWAQRGVRGVRLETFAIGGRRYTTKEAFERFVERTTQAAQGRLKPIQKRTSQQTQASMRYAEEELASDGI